MATVFVSYNQGDALWAHKIRDVLTSLGHEPHLHDMEVAVGGDIYEWTESRLRTADRFLCVVSPDYLKAEAVHSAAERNAAYALVREGEKPDGYLLVVVVKKCAVPPFMKSFKRCELYRLAEVEAHRELEKYLKAIGPGGTSSPPRIGPITNLPRLSTRDFMGRDTEMSKIETLLKQRSDGLAAVALVGLPGTGKSTLAIKYSDNHRHEYSALWWVRAETDQGISADLVGLGTALGWVRPADGVDIPVSLVKERLAHEGDGILLICDNSPGRDALAKFLPRDGKAHVLVTSNENRWYPIAEEIKVDRWPTAVGAAYLLKRTAEPDAAEALAHVLGGLPLALEVAASYCKHTGITLQEFLRRFEDKPLSLFERTEVLPQEFHSGLSVPKAFALVLDAARHEGARPLIKHAALLAPEPIPVSLFKEGQAALADPLRKVIRDGEIDAAIGALRVFSLIDRKPIPDERDATKETDSLQLHSLLRAFVSAQLSPGERAQILCSLVAAMAEVYPQDDPYVVSRWPEVRRLDAHAFALVGENVELPAGAELAAAELMNRLGAYRQSSATDYVQARKLFDRALKIRKEKLGSDHAKVAESLNSLALLSWVEGDEDPSIAAPRLAAARSLCQESLSIREKALGPNHPDVATSLINMARITKDADPQTATSSITRALSILEASSPEHPDVGTALMVLGWVLMVKGDLRAAAEHFRRARSIFEGAFGPDHPAIASTLQNFAEVRRKEGKTGEARQLLEDALTMNEKVMGPEHPVVAGVLSDLATVLQEERRKKEARPLLKKAAKILAKAYGPEHPRTKEARKQLSEVN